MAVRHAVRAGMPSSSWSEPSPGANRSSSSPVLLISGEPGVGKTALLDAAAEIAEQRRSHGVAGHRTRVRGRPAYGALNQVLYPLLDALDSVDEVHRHAIAVICGLEPGPPPTQLIAGAATLALVTQAAQTMPLFVIIDDVPWLDLASAMAFAYLARRLVRGRRAVPRRRTVGARERVRAERIRRAHPGAPAPMRTPIVARRPVPGAGPERAQADPRGGLR